MKFYIIWNVRTISAHYENGAGIWRSGCIIYQFKVLRYILRDADSPLTVTSVAFITSSHFVTTKICLWIKMYRRVFKISLDFILWSTASIPVGQSFLIVSRCSFDVTLKYCWLLIYTYIIWRFISRGMLVIIRLPVN